MIKNGHIAFGGSEEKKELWLRHVTEQAATLEFAHGEWRVMSDGRAYMTLEVGRILEWLLVYGDTNWLVSVKARIILDESLGIDDTIKQVLGIPSKLLRVMSIYFQPSQIKEIAARFFPGESDEEWFDRLINHVEKGLRRLRLLPAEKPKRLSQTADYSHLMAFLRAIRAGADLTGVCEKFELGLLYKVREILSSANDPKLLYRGAVDAVANLYEKGGSRADFLAAADRAEMLAARARKRWKRYPIALAANLAISLGISLCIAAGGVPSASNIRNCSLGLGLFVFLVCLGNLVALDVANTLRTAKQSDRARRPVIAALMAAYWAARLATGDKSLDEVDLEFVVCAESVRKDTYSLLSLDNCGLFELLRQPPIPKMLEPHSSSPNPRQF